MDIKDKTYEGFTPTFGFKEITTKGNKKYVVEGYISTSDVDLYGEMVTDECMDDMLDQLNSRTIKMDEEHETYHEKDYDLIPKLKIVKASKDEKGLWVQAELNQAHPDFKALWSSIKGGFLDAFSIQFVPVEAVSKSVKGEIVKVLQKVNLINVGITGTPVNPEATLDKVMVKALTDMYPKQKEEKDEDEDKKTKVKAAITLLKANGYEFVDDLEVRKITEKGESKLDSIGMNDSIKITSEKDVLKNVKALSLSSFKDQPSHSTSSEEDTSNKMAEEIKPEVPEAKAEEAKVDETKVEVKDTKEEAKSEEKSEDKVEPKESAAEAEVKALKVSLKELKEQMAKVQKQLDAPEMKATQETSPQTTKFKDSTTVLGLIK